MHLKMHLLDHDEAQGAAVVVHEEAVANELWPWQMKM